MGRRETFSVGEYYHIYGRGNDKRNIFCDSRDWVRFLFLILYFQSGVPFYNIGQYVTNFTKHHKFNVPKNKTEILLSTRIIELVAFCLMPNHFHLIVRESKERGISAYMQRNLTGYTMYFNTKYERSGHLFQGPFQSVHIEDNDQLLYLSTYIHRNPRELIHWKNKEHEYPYSSLQDYLKNNRWGKLLEYDVILSQFNGQQEFRDFTDISIAKTDMSEKIMIDHK